MAFRIDDTMDSKIIAILVAAVIVVAGVAVFFLMGQNGSDRSDTPETKTFLDMSENEVIMPEKIDAISVIGVGSLRVFCHLGLAEKICASDQLQNGATYGSNTYMYAYDELWNKDEIKSASDARQAVNLEKILTSNKGEKPDVLAIVDTVAENNRTVIDSIKKAGVTVFEIQSVQELMTSDGRISPLYEKQLTRIGAAFGVPERAKQLIDGVNAIFDDVKGLTGSVSVDSYIGGLTVASSRGLNITAPSYPPFILAGTKNIVQEGSPALDAGGTAAGVSVNIEKLSQIMDDKKNFKMFVDPASWRLANGLCPGDLLIGTTLANLGITEGFVVTPFHSYGMEYDNILVNCYIIAGELFDIDEKTIREKIDKVYELYYGKAAVNDKGVKLYDEMMQWYLEKSHCEFGKSVKFGVNEITMTDGTVLSG